MVKLPTLTLILSWLSGDGGGSNNANHYIFKEDLQKLVNEIGIEIRIAHYPPYTSKYNQERTSTFSSYYQGWSRSNFYKFRISQSSRRKNSN